MAKQRPIHVCIWDDPDFQEFTPEGKLIFIHLLTNKAVTESGIYPYTYKSIEDGTGIERAEVKRMIQEELKKNVEFDSKYHLIWMKNRLRYNKIGNPKVVIRSILNDYHAMKRSHFWDQYWEYNQPAIEQLIEKSENLKRDISMYRVILPDRLVELSLNIRQLLVNS